MSVNLRAVLKFFSDAIDKVMLVTGFFLLIAAVALFSKAYQWPSAASFILGVLLIVAGGIVHSSESFKLKVPSIEGWGAILICASVVLMATAVMLTLFAVPGAGIVMPTSWHRGPSDSVILIELKRPNAWLSPILVWIGVGLLVLGFLLRFSRDIF